MKIPAWVIADDVAAEAALAFTTANVNNPGHAQPVANAATTSRANAGPEAAVSAANVTAPAVVRPVMPRKPAPPALSVA